MQQCTFVLECVHARVGVMVCMGHVGWVREGCLCAGRSGVRVGNPVGEADTSRDGVWRGQAGIGVEVVAARVGAAICGGVEVGMGTCKSRSREQGQVSLRVYMSAGHGVEVGFLGVAARQCDGDRLVVVVSLLLDGGSGRSL